MKKLINILLLIPLLLQFGCKDPFQDETFRVYDEQPISSYLETRSDEFSEWIAILRYADMYNALNQSSQIFTMFAPTNEAVEAFYEMKAVGNIEELGRDYARQLVRYHVAGDSITLAHVVEGGMLTTKTLTDDYLEVVVGEEGGINALYMNGDAHIKEAAIPTANGLIYVLNDMMRPMFESIYQIMHDNGRNTIMIEAFEKTGWRDSLNIIADTVEHPILGIPIEQRRYYTILGVPDEVFQQQGIGSVDELAAYLGAGSDYTNKDNALFQYLGYHIIRGNYRLDNLKKFELEATSNFWETGTPNALMKISIESDGLYYLNYETGDGKAKFIDAESDFLVKNGYIHQIDDVLPIATRLTPAPVIFDFCNYPDLAGYISTNGVEGQLYQRAGPAEYTTNLAEANLASMPYQMGPMGNPNTGGALGYLTLRDQPTNQFFNSMFKDVLELQLGFMGNVTLTSPPILPGKYKVSLVYLYANSLDPLSRGEGSNGGQTSFELEDATGNRRANVVLYSQVTLDGRMGIYTQSLFNEVTFEEAGRHRVKITINDPAASTFAKFQIRLDYLLFEPIN